MVRSGAALLPVSLSRSRVMTLKASGAKSFRLERLPSMETEESVDVELGQPACDHVALLVAVFVGFAPGAITFGVAVEPQGE